MSDELEEVKRIARQAGAILLRHYHEPSAVQWKSPCDPVTAADREASELILSELGRLFPEDGVLSEEAPDEATRFGHHRVWLIDPMDGTREFIEHRDEFAVMIGRLTDGVPSLGVVYQPTSDKLYYAEAGHGAFLEQGANRHELHVSNEAVAANMTLAVSRSHKSSRIEKIRETLRIPRSIPSGSVGLKVGLILEQRAHLYIHPGNYTHIWDTCAPDAIIYEGGGVMTDIYGERLRYLDNTLRNPNGIVASNGQVHARALQVTQLILFG
jgi:3'(2'), 5'-bisphosphate nucleotidase